MALFLSQYRNKIDKKGRVSVPAPFRAILANECFHGVVAYASFVNACVEGCGMSRIEQLNDSIEALDPFSEERAAFETTILGGSVQLPFDSEGRVLLSDNLMELGGLSDQAVFVGKGKTFEIWNPETFAEYAEKAREMARSQRGVLRAPGAAGSRNGGGEQR